MKLSIEKILNLLPSVMATVEDNEPFKPIEFKIETDKEDAIKKETEWGEPVDNLIVKSLYGQVRDLWIADFNMNVRNQSERYEFDGEINSRIMQGLSKLEELNPDYNGNKCLIIPVKVENELRKAAGYTFDDNQPYCYFRQIGMYAGTKVYSDQMNSLMENCPIYACLDTAELHYNPGDIEVEKVESEDGKKYVYTVKVCMKMKYNENEKYVEFN